MPEITVTEPSPGVVLATLDRPERLNALTPEMFVELHELATRLASDASARVLVLTGAGRGFCSGYDLALARDLPVMTAMQMFSLQESAAASFAAIRELPIPVIAAVNGPAAGGGLALALAADIRIAAPSASFVAAFVTIGLSAGDLGTSWLLPRAVGPSVAAEIVYTGRRVDADEAERIHLVNRIVESDALLDDALALAERIAANSPQGVRFSKRALQANLEIGSFRQAMELENRGQALASRHPDMPEALAAFKDRRVPNFVG
jgi:enoyl-CoA hydratase/carnithine racemase